MDRAIEACINSRFINQPTRVLIDSRGSAIVLAEGSSLVKLENSLRGSSSS